MECWDKKRNTSDEEDEFEEASSERSSRKNSKNEQEMEEEPNIKTRTTRRKLVKTSTL
jgi:hypothetical protein